MTYLELALYALQQLARPAGSSEICGFIEQNRLYTELDSYNPEQGLPPKRKKPDSTSATCIRCCASFWRSILSLPHSRAPYSTKKAAKAKKGRTNGSIPIWWACSSNMPITNTAACKPG